MKFEIVNGGPNSVYYEAFDDGIFPPSSWLIIALLYF